MSKFLVAINSFYLVIILTNYLAYLVYMTKLAFHESSSVKQLGAITSLYDLPPNEKLYLDSIALLSIEFIALAVISLLVLIILLAYRRVFSSTESYQMTISAAMFLMLLPFFYTLRLPLILAIINALKGFAPIDVNITSSFFTKCLDSLLKLENYLLFDVTSSSKRYDLMLLKTNKHMFQQKLARSL